MAKLAALIPALRVHLARYHGVLAPAAKWRPLIVPTPVSQPDVPSVAVPLSQSEPASINASNTEAPTEAQAAAAATPLKRTHTWAHLMMRVFALDVLQCERCGGHLRILAAIHPPDTTLKILDCLGLPSRAPPLAPAVSAVISD